MANPTEAVRAYLASIGSKGGSVKGKSKSRGTAGARKAALARWAKRKPKPAM